MPVKNAPPAFNGMVPMEPGIGWYIKYLYEIGELGPGKRIAAMPSTTLPANVYINKFTDLYKWTILHVVYLKSYNKLDLKHPKQY